MKDYIKSIIQHGITSAGAVLVACGIIDNDVLDQFVDANTEFIAGGILYLVGQIWSLIKK